MLKIYKKLAREIWQLNENQINESKFKVVLIRFLKIIILTFRGFAKNKDYLRASALTYYTLFSTVPVLALAFAICKGFGLDAKLETELFAKFSGQEVILTKILLFAQNLLARTKGGIIAGVGIIILLWTVIKLFGNIEKAFNAIWQSKHRSIYRKITDYLSMAFVCPILLIISGSLVVYVTTGLAQYDVYGIIPHPLKIALSNLSSHIVIWILFTFVYKLLPNCKVSFKSAVIPGIIAGTAFTILQFSYFNFQVFVTRYNAIYGSFAALPLFLMWIQLSYLIILFGAELSFAIENIELFEHEYSVTTISHKQRKIVNLMVTNVIIKNFKEGKEPLTPKNISTSLHMPYGLVSESLKELIKGGIISIVLDKNEKIIGYQPSRCINDITFMHVLKQLELSSKTELPVYASDSLKKISETLRHFDSISETDPHNIPLKDI